MLKKNWKDFSEKECETVSNLLTFLSKLSLKEEVIMPMRISLARNILRRALNRMTGDVDAALWGNIAIREQDDQQGMIGLDELLQSQHSE